MKMNLTLIAYLETQRLAAKGRQIARKITGYLKYLWLPLALMAYSAGSHAITAPTTGTFAYDLYDVAVNQMIKGPVGFVGGMVAVIVSAMNITKNYILAGGGILGGTALIKSDSITASLGAIA